VAHLEQDHGLLLPMQLRQVPPSAGRPGTPRFLAFIT
jgi:hypothetical protein